MQLLCVEKLSISTMFGWLVIEQRSQNWWLEYNLGPVENLSADHRNTIRDPFKYVLEFWKKQQIYEKSLERRAEAQGLSARLVGPSGTIDVAVPAALFRAASAREMGSPTPAPPENRIFFTRPDL